MSAVRSPAAAAMRPELRPLTPLLLDAVIAIEVAAYAFPWSRGNFIDSLAAGHPARVLVGEAGAVHGYFIAMDGVAEMHLLNLTVAPAVQRRGHARSLLDALVGVCRQCGAATLWLEVREGNAHARGVYEHLGFAPVGRRKNYYPAPLGRREDAIVMNLAVEPFSAGDGHALE